MVLESYQVLPSFHNKWHFSFGHENLGWPKKLECIGKEKEKDRDVLEKANTALPRGGVGGDDY